MRACIPLALAALTACALPGTQEAVPCTREAALVGLDGGPVVCVMATDCPRAGVLVCGSAEDHLVGCVDCVETRCVEYARVVCP